MRASGWARVTGLTVLAVFTVTLLTIGYCLSNPNTLKPLAEVIIEWAVDRPLEINGDLELTLSMTPVISVTDARLGNMAGGTAPYMITASFALAQIDLGALFDNRLHLLDLQVKDAVLHLEDRVGGEPNWHLFDTDEDDGGEDRWSFMIQQLEVTDSRIFATIGELAPIELTIPFLEETSDDSDNLNLNGYGELNGDPWRVNGQIGPFSELLIAGRLTMALDLLVDDVEIAVNGGVGDLATLSEIDLRMNIYGPDADLLGEIFRMPDSFAGDVALEAEIRPAADSAGHTMRVSGHVADFDVDTAGTITNLLALDGWDGSARISGPDLGVFGKALQIEGFPDGPFDVRGAVHLHGGDLDLKGVSVQTEDLTLLLEADFEQFPKRQGAFGSIRLSGQYISEFSTLLQLPDLPEVPFNVELNLDTSGSEVLNASITVGRHHLMIAGAFGEFPDFTGTDLNVSADGDDLATLLAAFSIRLPFSGAYTARSRLIVDQQGLSLLDSSLEFPGHSLSGDIFWQEPPNLRSPQIQGQLSLDDLASTGALFDIRGLPSYPLTSTASLQVEDGQIELTESLSRMRSLEMRVDGSLGLPGDLNELDLNVALSGARLLDLFGVALERDGEATPFELGARIRGEGGALRFSDFELNAPGGTIEAAGRLALTPGLAGSGVVLQGRGTNFGDLVPAFPAYQPPSAPWRLQAEIELRDGDHLLVRDSRLEIGSVDIRLDGTLDTVDQTRTQLTFTAKGERIGDIGRIAEIAFPEYPFHVTAELEGTMDSLLIKSIDARWGESDLSGEGSMLLGDRPKFAVRGRSKVLDIYDLQHALFGAPENTDPADDDEKIFADMPIPTHLFANFDGSLEVQVDRFRGQRARLEDVKLEIEAEDGALIMKRAAYRDDFGFFNASATLRPDNESVYLELKLIGEDADFGLFTSTAQNKESVPRYSLDVDIWGYGRTVAEMAGGLNGKILVSSDGGEINNGLVEAFAGDFVTNVLETLNPFVESETFTKMECLVLNAGIRDGRLRMEPGFVMRTDRLNMFVYGSANLKRETLDLSLATQARRGIGISAASITNPYFKIGGTLASPALQLDPASAAVAASVATATAGLSILVRGVFERLMGSKNPCPEFLNYEQSAPERPGRRAES